MVATGLTAALTFLMLALFWAFSSEQIYYWTPLVVLSALIGLLIAPRASERWDKKGAAIRLGLLAFTVQPLPVVCRLIGWMRYNGEPLLFPILAVVNTVYLGLIIAMQAILY